MRTRLIVAARAVLANVAAAGPVALSGQKEEGVKADRVVVVDEP